MTTRPTTSFVVNSLMIILSTIHSHDMRDEIGDRLMGRWTVPIVWPTGSRIGIFAMSITWSVSLMWACDLAYHFSVPLHISGPHQAVLYARADNRRRRVLIAITSCLLAIQAMRSKGKASIKTIPYFSEDMGSWPHRSCISHVNLHVLR